MYRRHAFSEPFRWLSGKCSTLKGMSLWRMGDVLDEVEQKIIQLQANPSLIFDSSFDMFSKAASAFPEFAEWRAAELESTVTAEDGETEIAEIADVVWRLPPVAWETAPILYSVPLHLFGYHAAVERDAIGLGAPRLGG